MICNGLEHGLVHVSFGLSMPDQNQPLQAFSLYFSFNKQKSTLTKRNGEKFG
jgi:hypothetical protein